MMTKEEEQQVDYKEENPEALMNRLLWDALQKGASDIHIEPERDQVVIRFRVDGFLYVIDARPKDEQEQLMAHIKVLARLDISERRLPQDGHFEFTDKKQHYNLRVSTYPTVYGEAAALRIMNREEALMDMGALGFNKSQLATMQHLISQPYGLMLITGPTGSGKSTLLYSILRTLNKTENNIVTIEDPVELQMQGVRQAQVQEGAGFTFAKALRSILRQDPDIVMVGEVRDRETAEIAIQAALVGRLVFSTFHTLNVYGLITRLFEMNIPRSVIANAMTGVVSARLVRKICDNCRVSYELSEEEELVARHHFPSIKEFHKGEGCKKCLNSGYKGRTGIFEIVYFDDELRAIIVEKPTFVEISSYLKRANVTTLLSSALQKVADGVTTLEEVRRVVGLPLTLGEVQGNH